MIHSVLNGEQIQPKEISGEWPILLDGKIIEKCAYSYPQIDEMLKALKMLHLKNGSTQPLERLNFVKLVLDKVLEKKSLLQETVQLELGRSAADLALEWAQIERLRSLCEFDFLKKGNVEFREARGITAYVGSYVWPLFYSLQFICFNILAGNTLVIKPSERSTLTVATLVNQLVELPELKSWIHLLVGEKESGRRLVCHENVNTVIFMGSFEVGMRVKQDTLSQSWKEVLLYLGAKNPAILAEDYPAHALPTILQDSFLTMGQHCRSTSLIFVHESRLEEFQEQLHEEAKKIPMSRLIDPSMVERYLKFSGISEREGANVEMRGKPLQTGVVTPTLSVFRKVTADLIRKSVTLQTEILSPHLSILPFSSNEQLGEWMEKLQWGLCASVWTLGEAEFKSLAKMLPIGQIAWNQSLLSWDAMKSFQAYKKSGNHAYHGLKLLDQLTSLKSVLV
jgi:succinylglutamic semialdehyde dehydrogenase